jgi:hypothetical protein
MICRCENRNAADYPRYGGRGIRVCERWRSSVEQFMADMGPRPTAKHSIERIDVNGNYEPANCRWATMDEQARNKRSNIRVTFEGRTLCLKEWSRELGVKYLRLYYRIVTRGEDAPAVLAEERARSLVDIAEARAREFAEDEGIDLETLQGGSTR